MKARLLSLYHPIFFYALAICICFAISSHVFPFFSKDFFNQSFLSHRASRIVSLSRHPSLARCFFQNTPIFDNELYEIMRQAGLLHLTAISGGQVRLVLDLAARVPLGIFLFFSRYISQTRNSAVLSHRLFTLLEPILAGVVAIVFGCSGSLQRVWILHYAVNNTWFRRPALTLSTRYPHLSTQLVRRFFALIIICILFGNPWLNLSFLLSASGSGLASLIAEPLYDKNDGIVKSFLKRTAAISLLTAVVLIPLSNTNLVITVVANAICLPLVDLLLVPMAMSLLFIPFSYDLTSAGVLVFDSVIDVFLLVANSFGLSSNQTNEGWSEWSFTYLSFVVILVWTLQERRALRMRRRLQTLVSI